jgi:hypothetical protein
VIYHGCDKGSWSSRVIDRQILQRVWQELDYRFDICRVTKGGHTERL